VVASAKDICCSNIIYVYLCPQVRMEVHGDAGVHAVQVNSVWRIHRKVQVRITDATTNSRPRAGGGWQLRQG
jgi:hypothetical protein